MMPLHVDTREQDPFTFTVVKKAAVEYRIVPATLPEGDYATPRAGQEETRPREHPDAWAIVERKSLADLYGTAAAGRDRFERELERLKPYGFKAIVIEAEWSEILVPNEHLRHPTKFRPKSMLASLLAWAQRFDVHIVTCPGRQAAELITFRMLERWYRDGTN